MTWRCAIGATLAAILLAGVTGCTATSSGSFTRTRAQSDSAAWTKQAVASLTPRVTARTIVNDFEVCRTDHGYFSTLSQWRTISSLSVPLARQAGAMRDIQTAFETNGWAASTSRGILTLRGPADQKLKGLITLQPASDSQLSIEVISPCYK